MTAAMIIAGCSDSSLDGHTWTKPLVPDDTPSWELVSLKESSFYTDNGRTQIGRFIVTVMVDQDLSREDLGLVAWAVANDLSDRVDAWNLHSLWIDFEMSNAERRGDGKAEGKWGPYGQWPIDNFRKNDDYSRHDFVLEFFVEGRGQWPPCDNPQRNAQPMRVGEIVNHFDDKFRLTLEAKIRCNGPYPDDTHEDIVIWIDSFETMTDVQQLPCPAQGVREIRHWLSKEIDNPYTNTTFLGLGGGLENEIQCGGSFSVDIGPDLDEDNEPILTYRLLG